MLTRQELKDALNDSLFQYIDTHDEPEAYILKDYVGLANNLASGSLWCTIRSLEREVRDEMSPEILEACIFYGVVKDTENP